MGNKKKLKKRSSAAQRLTNRLLDIRKTLTGRFNGYICNTCEKGFLTLDVDPGSTPAISPCFATEGCSGLAHSMGYPEGDPPLELGDPIFYWHKPSEEELSTLSEEMQEHARNGGLVRRTTEAAPEWVKRATSSS